MRRIVFGLLLVPLIACSDVLADDAQVPTAMVPSATGGGSQQAQVNKKLRSEQVSPPSQIDRARKRKQASITRSRGASAPAALPLSSAEAYATEQPANLAISSVPKQAPLPSNFTSTSPSTSWTGFHVGVGVGAAQP